MLGCFLAGSTDAIRFFLFRFMPSLVNAGPKLVKLVLFCLQALSKYATIPFPFSRLVFTFHGSRFTWAVSPDGPSNAKFQAQIAELLEELPEYFNRDARHEFN